MLVLFQPFAFGNGETMAEMASGFTTANVAELLAPAPGTVTTTATAPSGTPAGTVTTMLPALHEVIAALMPPKVTVLVPWVAPKFEPAMVTEKPIGPDAGVRLVIDGATTVTSGLISTKCSVHTSAFVAAALRVAAAAIVGNSCAGGSTACVQG